MDGTKPLIIKKDIGDRIGTVYSGPWPAYPTDLMSVAIVAATQAQGTVIFFEKMYEGRMFFTDKLMGMGANIVLCDPHRVVVTGPSQLYATSMSSPDVRAGMALLMAATIALGKSEIHNIYQIERGYQAIDRKLEALGAAIRKVEA
jgi:UDP-N-acetylglucosamine 1-carboxyvinyltransferase